MLQRPLSLAQHPRPAVRLTADGWARENVASLAARSEPIRAAVVRRASQQNFIGLNGTRRVLQAAQRKRLANAASSKRLADAARERSLGKRLAKAARESGSRKRLAKGGVKYCGVVARELRARLNEVLKAGEQHICVEAGRLAVERTQWPRGRRLAALR